MAVNPEYANQLLADFQSRIEGIVRTNGLEHHIGTSNLSDIDAVKQNYIDTVMNTFTLPTTTEGELEAEMNGAIVQITRMVRDKSDKEYSDIAGIGSTVNKMSAADSNAWNTIIGDTGHRIDKIVTLYADQINNMPKALRARIDDDMAKVLDAINSAYNANPSPANAEIVSLQVKNSLDKIENDLSEASKALLKASIEGLVHSKMTELQEKQYSLQSVEKGMTKGQIESYRQLSKEIEKLILDLGKSNYLIYDKSIRNQKIAIIDSKLALLENIRVNAAGVSHSLSGYFGNTGLRAVRKAPSLGGVGTTLGMNTSQVSPAPKNYRNGVPPGFAGFAGKMTKSDIAAKHAPNTAQSHIDAMAHHMSRGMSFNDAHNKANAQGFTPQSHDKTFSLGGGGHPFW